MAQQIEAYQCRHCKFQTLIPTGYCFCCRRENSFDQIELEGKGKIFSYTTVYVSEERLQSEVPYVIAIIECAGGLRLLGRIDKSSMDAIQIGTNVEFLEWRDGAPIFTGIMEGETSC